MGNYRLPFFPVIADIYSADSIAGSRPRVSIQAQKEPGTRSNMGLAAISEFAQAPNAAVFLLMPFNSDIRGICDPRGADFVNVHAPNGSSNQWYRCSHVDNSAMSFGNQHDVAVLTQLCPFYKDGTNLSPPADYPFPLAGGYSGSSSSGSGGGGSGSGGGGGGGEGYSGHLIQTANQALNSNSSNAVTWGSATTAGSALVAGVSTNFMMSITPPSGWILVNSCSSGIDIYLHTYYYPNAPSETTSTWGFGGPCDSVVILGEYSNGATSTLDQQNTNTGTGTTASTLTTGTLTYSDEIAVAFFASSNFGFGSPATNGYTIETSAGNVGDGIVAFCDLLTSSAIGTHTTIPITASSDWCASIFTLT